MNKLIKSAAFISIGGLAVVGAIALFQEYGPLHLHQDDPIIIDNGPAYWKVLPKDHGKYLLDHDPDAPGYVGGMLWQITQKNQFNFLKILTDGATACGSNPCFDLKAWYPVSFRMKDKDDKAAGTLAVSWAGTTGRKGTVSFLPTVGFYNVRWKREGGSNEWHKLRAKVAGERYSIDQVIFHKKNGNKEEVWTKPSGSTVKVLLCVKNDSKCVDPEP